MNHFAKPKAVDFVYSVPTANDPEVGEIIPERIIVIVWDIEQCKHDKNYPSIWILELG